MKRKLSLIFSIFILIFFYNDCAKEKKVILVAPIDPVDLVDPEEVDPPPPPKPRQGFLFEFKSAGALSKYTENSERPLSSLNQIEDPRIEISLYPFESGHYGGEVTISFYETTQNNSILRKGTFQSRYDNADDNIWAVANNLQVWQGFFQDSLGAVILIIEGTLGTGEGEDVSEVFGSLWLKNFPKKINGRPVNRVQGPSPCWKIYAGPYDCRAWKQGNSVSTNRTLHPDSGYLKLGTFSGPSLNDIGLDVPSY